MRNKQHKKKIKKQREEEACLQKASREERMRLFSGSGLPAACGVFAGDKR